MPATELGDWAVLRPRRAERAVCITLGGDRYREFARHSPDWIAAVPGVRWNGHDGVSIAHLIQYRRALRSGAKLLTVFEDDARLNRPVTRADVASVTRFRRDPGSSILLLGYSWHTHDMKRVNTVRTTGHAVDFHAYMITERGMRDVLRVFPPIRDYRRFMTLGSIDGYAMSRVVDGLALPLFVQCDNHRYDEARRNPLRRCNHSASATWFEGSRLCHRMFHGVYGWSASRLAAILGGLMLVIAMVMLRTQTFYRRVQCLDECVMKNSGV
jgi:hypothetical protein